MGYKNINNKHLKELLHKKEDIVILDIRSKEEFNERNIEGSKNIPLEEILYNIIELEEYKDQKIIVYCRSGHRSITACNLLSMEGFSNLYNLEKGINGYI